MDYIKSLGSLALASRLRRVLDEIHRQGKRVYSELGIEFEIRWFSVIHFVANNPKSAITEIAHSLRLKHPSIIQVVNEMTERGLLESAPDSRDRRRKLIRLTPEGCKLIGKMTPVWEAFDKAGKEIVREMDNDLIGALAKFESALARQSLYDRILIKIKSKKESN